MLTALRKAIGKVKHPCWLSMNGNCLKEYSSGKNLTVMQGFPGHCFKSQTAPHINKKNCQAKSYSSATYDSTEQMRIVKTNKGHFVKNFF